MELRVSLRERFLLEAWLPNESPPGAIQVDARSLVAVVQTLAPGEVRDRLEKLRTCLRKFKSSRSMLDVQPPLGRGRPLRMLVVHSFASLSPWEVAWLVVDHLKSDGQFKAPLIAIKELEDRLHTSFLNALAIAVLCLETAPEAQELVNSLTSARSVDPSDRPWVQWLAGRSRAPVRVQGTIPEHFGRSSDAWAGKRRAAAVGSEVQGPCAG